jgi:hypothetical protein
MSQFKPKSLTQKQPPLGLWSFQGSNEPNSHPWQPMNEQTPKSIGFIVN